MGHTSAITASEQSESSTSHVPCQSSESSPNSLFERVFYIYARDELFNVVFERVFPDATKKVFNWRDLISSLRNQNRRARGNSAQDYETRELDERDVDGIGHRLVVFEKRRKGGLYAGIIVENFIGGCKSEQEFARWFIQRVLSSSFLDSLSTLNSESIPSGYGNIHQRIADIFSSRLRFSPHGSDCWDVGGEAFFKKVVSNFLARGAAVEFVLPAFPCKSTSPEKVCGKSPDMGEELAMRNLISFCDSVQGIYPPGAKIWIVSDGHVFSDCIGVDDEEVDEYNRLLRSVTSQIQGNECIQFVSLRDIFGFTETGQCSLTIPKDVFHPLKTNLSATDEFCRRALAAACRPAPETLRNAIRAADGEDVGLYRGLSKFMLKDLAHHEEFTSVSKSRKKKMASEIAFEMLLRNQSYSNLVELFFPACIRLSIHAHANKGPKFGISLMPKDLCRTISGSHDQDIGAEKRRLETHHIPTPWHNVVVELGSPGGVRYIVTKASYVGSPGLRWIMNDGGLGGRFVPEADKGLGGPAPGS